MATPLSTDSHIFPGSDIGSISRILKEIPCLTSLIRQAVVRLSNCDEALTLTFHVALPVSAPASIASFPR